MNMEECLNRALAETQKQIDSGIIQGAVIGTADGPVAAIGDRMIEPVHSPMTTRCRFDIASTGKVFTASCAALLIQQGKLDPEAPFTEYLPEHILGKNCDIKIRDLASHSSGFSNDKPYHATGKESFYRELFRMKPVRPRLAAFEYSCYNMILLGTILNRITGLDLDALARKLIWKPLGMDETTWNAPGNGPDEVQHHIPTREPGVHNDPVCYDAGFPLGSGSCFSTFADMAKFVRDLRDRKQFPAAYYDLLMTCCFKTTNSFGFEVIPEARRSFGWNMSANERPEGFSDATVYHTGWTGQTIVLDPATGKNGIVMTSRLPDCGKDWKDDWEMACKGRTRIIELLNGTVL